ncbi:NADH dehydrogenase [ubiquinone] 1 alpha subcomplex subunit 8-like [Clavelina lepadiformis]|uniref:NADH dehydrogenase [ubiquinone] 1 alpha subcomplex subunit 8 n=1 Tax=Clavelina lepadiformis TaxID=159417 RepID=A0ABP0F376_CLALP
MTSMFNVEPYIPGTPYELENTEGIKEKIDPELKDVFRAIKRGHLGIPSHALKAAAFQYAVQCNPVNQEFMLCKSEEGHDPRRCLKYNEKVADCAENFYKKITDVCGESFLKFAQCLEHNTERCFSYCRDQQLKFDKCAYEKLGYDKAKFPLERDTTIQTDRPKPVNPYNFEKHELPKPFAADWNRPITKPDGQ